MAAGVARHTRHHRALGAADTIARLINESGVGWSAGAALEDGPLFATLRATADNGKTVHITIEELGMTLPDTNQGTR